MTARSDSIRWLVVRWPSNRSLFWLMISCRAVSDFLCASFQSWACLFVQLNLGESAARSWSNCLSRLAQVSSLPVSSKPGEVRLEKGLPGSATNIANDALLGPSGNLISRRPAGHRVVAVRRSMGRLLAARRGRRRRHIGDGTGRPTGRFCAELGDPQWRPSDGRSCGGGVRVRWCPLGRVQARGCLLG